MYRDGIKSTGPVTGDKKGMALQMWHSSTIGDNCEHFSIAWPGPVSVTH